MVAIVRLVGVADDLQGTLLLFDLAVLRALFGFGEAYKNRIAQEQIHGFTIYLGAYAMLLYCEEGGIPIKVGFFVANPIEDGNYVVAQVLHDWPGNG